MHCSSEAVDYMADCLGMQFTGSLFSHVFSAAYTPSNEIIQTQEAIVERLDRIMGLQEQMVALKAYKLNVRLEKGKTVPRY